MPPLSIRTKALLLLPLLLVIPYVGYQYVREMEDFLRDGLEQSVLGAARALAGALHEQRGLFREARPGDEGVIYAHPLRQPIEIDGYTSDWADYGDALAPLAVRPPRVAPGDARARYVAGKHGAYLHLLVAVEDDEIAYRRPAGRADRADHLELVTGDSRGTPRRYVLSTISPGWVNGYELPLDDTPDEDQFFEQSLYGDMPAARAAPARLDVRIRAEWRGREDGYVLEVRLPLSMLGPRLALTVVDVDPGEPPPARATPDLRPLLLPSSDIEALIARLGRVEGRRVWVVDTAGRVLARGGTLERDVPPPAINPLYALILRPPGGELAVDPPIVSRLEGPEIEAALAGRSGTRWRATADADLWLVSGAHPVWVGDHVLGAVVVEETSLAIQTVTRQALATLFNTTLAVSAAGALVLLLFASRIGARLRRLRDEAEAAIDAHGRVTGSLSNTHGHDEIGDLAGSMSAMMERLRQYNQYLENLARRLSHELRTPIAVVRSSLELLELEPSAEPARVYGERARQGLARLDAVIARMSEASRLEHAIDSAEKERFDLDRVVSSAVEAYRTAWPGRRFAYAGPGRPAEVEGVPDLIVQMLDKLVSNALELGRSERPIDVHVSTENRHVALDVINYGSRLPATMHGRLFESMVSVRPASRERETTPHLGLGLYIARLIAEFHHGRISGENLPGPDGVRFSVVLPAARERLTSP